MKKFNNNIDIHAMSKKQNTIQSELKGINEAIDLLLKEDLNFVQKDMRGQAPQKPQPTAPVQKPTQAPTQQNANMEQEAAEEGQEISPSVKEKINQIRAIALDGIRELADNPTSKEYDVMKRIWNICDKSINDNDKIVSKD